jgi:DNA polymerase III delta prime subunit
MYDNFVFVEKYRPRKLEEVILPARLIEETRGHISKGKIPNLLMSGSAGIGKTTLALVMCNELDYEYMMVNCSDEGRFLDTFRNKVAAYCTGISIEGKRKCLILDEIDNLTHDVQSLLRGFMEKYSSNCSFIATCNFPSRVMEPLKSRFASVDFNITPDEKKEMVISVFKRVIHILDNEAITYDKATVSKLVGKFFPDFRRMLNELQKYSSGGSVIDSGIFSAMTSEVDDLIKHMKSGYWSEMRKWVGMQTNLDMGHLCSTLYKRADEYMKVESIPQLVIHISEYQYKAAFVVDKEINVVAFLTSVMSDCEFK